MSIGIRRVALTALCALAALPGPANGQCPVEEAQIEPADGAPDHLFGYGLALSPDGGVLAVAAAWLFQTQPSACYVFEEGVSGWIEICRLEDPDGIAADTFGYAVATDGSGTRVFVGAPQLLGPPPGTPGPRPGIVHAFARAGTSWTQETELEPSGPQNWFEFGSALASDALGDRIAVGAPGWGVAGGSFPGAVWTFVRSGTTWTEEAMLLGSDAAHGDKFGNALALDAAGDTLVVGANLHDGCAAGSGAAFVFERSGTLWGEVAKIVPDACAGSIQLGGAVAITDPGDRIALGASADAAAAPYSGAAYVFSGGGAAWAEEARLVSSAPADTGAFGVDLALDADGDVLVVGASGETVYGLADAGAAHVFHRSGTDWTLAARTAPAGVETSDRFGLRVGLADSGTRFAGSAMGWVYGAGSAHVFRDTDGTPVAYCTAKTSSQGCAPFVTTTGTASASAAFPCTVAAQDLVNNKNGLLFYGVSGRAALPGFFGGFLCAQPPLRRTGFQHSFGNPPPDDCSGSLAFELNAWIQSGVDPALVPGALASAQYWARDPAHPDGTGVVLTDAVELPICP